MQFQHQYPATLELDYLPRDSVFIKGDIRDREFLRPYFAENRIDQSVAWFCLLESGESVAELMKYYDNNVSGSLKVGGRNGAKPASI